MKKLKNVSKIKMYAAGTALGLSLLAGCEAKTQAPVESKVVETTVDNTDVIDSTEVVVATQAPETTETVEVPKTTEATPESTEVVESTEVDPSNIIDTAETEEVFECTADDFIKFIEETSPKYPQIDKLQLASAVLSLNYDYFNDEEKDKIFDFYGCSKSDMAKKFQEYNDSLFECVLNAANGHASMPGYDKKAYDSWIRISDMMFNEKDLEMAKEYDKVLARNATADFGYYLDDPKDLKQDTASSFELSCRTFLYSLENPEIPVTVFNREQLTCSIK